jgi:hypothetical protein
LTFYSPNALTRSDILINLSEIFDNADSTAEPYPLRATPDSVFNLDA